MYMAPNLSPSLTSLSARYTRAETAAPWDSCRRQAKSLCLVGALGIVARSLPLNAFGFGFVSHLRTAQGGPSGQIVD